MYLKCGFVARSRNARGNPLTVGFSVSCVAIGCCNLSCDVPWGRRAPIALTSASTASTLCSKTQSFHVTTLQRLAIAWYGLCMSLSGGTGRYFPTSIMTFNRSRKSWKLYHGWFAFSSQSSWSCMYDTRRSERSITSPMESAMALRLLLKSKTQSSKSSISAGWSRVGGDIAWTLGQHVVDHRHVVGVYDQIDLL